MKTRFIPWLALVMLLAQGADKALANGGPLDEFSLKMNGNHEFKNVKSIELVQEDLKVTILGDDAEYQVTYQFLNHSKAVTVDYGFPVYFTGESGEALKKIDPKLVLRSFQMNDSGRDIPCETNVKAKPSKEDADWATYIIWNKAKLTFAENEKKSLKVDYRVKSANDDMIFSKSFKPEYSDRKTNYSFEGAKYWGDGKVGKVTVSIDDQALRDRGGKILSVSPGDYKKDATGYHKEYQNVAVGKIPRLMVTYDDQAAAFASYIDSIRIPRSAIVKIEASNTLAPQAGGTIHYDPENLLDGSLETAWVEGKGKAVTLDIWVKNYNVVGVGVLNGYMKNQEVFEENSRPSKIGVAIQKLEKTTDDLSDLREVELPKRKFQDFNPKQVLNFVDWIGDFGEGYGETEMIRLVIEDTWPGTKYKDTAISELYLLGYKAQKE